jgi:hypothetical protein
VLVRIEGKLDRVDEPFVTASVIFAEALRILIRFGASDVSFRSEKA